MQSSLYDCTCQNLNTNTSIYVCFFVAVRMLSKVRRKKLAQGWRGGGGCFYLRLGSITSITLTVLFHGKHSQPFQRLSLYNHVSYLLENWSSLPKSLSEALYIDERSMWEAWRQDVLFPSAIVHHCQLSWCSKQSNFILESFHGAAGELCVSSFWFDRQKTRN